MQEIVSTGSVACVNAGTAYVADLLLNYPTIQLYETNNNGEMVSRLKSGQCQAILESDFKIQALLNGAVDLLSPSSNTKWCEDGLQAVSVGQPDRKGFTDMAVGVGSDHPMLQSVLSYWITALRTCNENSPASKCNRVTSNATNLETLLSSYVKKQR